MGGSQFALMGCRYPDWHLLSFFSSDFRSKRVDYSSALTNASLHILSHLLFTNHPAVRRLVYNMIY